MVFYYESALAIGCISGVLHNVGYEFLLKCQIDDPVGAFPVHGICGVWGTLAVALFAPSDALSMHWIKQLGIQAFGCFVACIWACSTAYILFRILRSTIGLRVSYEEERAGLDITGEVVEQAPASLDIDIEELKKLMGE